MTYQRSETNLAAAGSVTIFAAIMLGINGVFQFLQGLAALFNDQFFVNVNGNIFSFDLTTWGWIHLILGVLLIATSVGLFIGQTWARAMGILFASLSALSQFLFMPYYPVWSIVMLIFDILVIWALSVFSAREIQ